MPGSYRECELPHRLRGSSSNKNELHPIWRKSKKRVSRPDIFRQKYSTGGHFDELSAGNGEESGLLYYNARYYDPMIGRFISADTMIPDPSFSQSFNRYMYVAGNPVSFNDPSGHKWGKSLWHKISGAIQGEDTHNSIDFVRLIKSTGNTVKDGWNSSRNWRNDKWDATKDWVKKNWFAVAIIFTIITTPGAFDLIELATVKFDKEGTDWKDLKHPYKNLVEEADWMNSSEEWSGFFKQR